MHVEPQVEHRWLENLVGEWTLESEADMGPDQQTYKTVGKERVQMLGEVWAFCEMESGVPDGEIAYSQMTLGYDPRAKSFVGTFVTSCMTYLWVYANGVLDDAGKVLTLNAVGPKFFGDGITQYQDVIEIVDDDHRILRGMMLDENEVWQEFMTTRYTRKR